MLGTGGSLAEHMALHIGLMNVAAPAVVLVGHSLASQGRSGPAPSVAAASIIQIVLLWGWHLPPSLAFAAGSGPAMACMHASLFFSSLWFWHAIVSAVADRRFHALGGVLITGKLFCLLGVLLALAPRPLYSAALLADATGSAHPHAPLSTVVPTLADQQMAGLLMLVACPLVYVLAGILIAARWMSEIERRPAWTALSERR